MKKKILDLAKETSLCGDIAIHVLEELEDMEPGSILVVRTLLPEDTVKESLSQLEAIGEIRVKETRKINGVLEVVVEKQ